MYLFVIILRPCSFFQSVSDDIGETRLYSQDPDKYVVWFDCLDGSADSYETCTTSFVYILVPDVEGRNETEPVEIDLNGLPWSKIAYDVKFATGRRISDFRYTWLGEGGLYYLTFWLLLRRHLMNA